MRLIRPFTHYAKPDVMGYLYWCPGCEELHQVRVAKEEGENVPVWDFNGNTEMPTFSPSVTVWGSDPAQRCHHFVKDGTIVFLNDCYHSLAGRTVPMEDADKRV